MYSLQSRLGLWLGLLLIVIFGVHVVLMSYFPRYLAEEQVLGRIKHDADFLFKRLTVEADKTPSLNQRELPPIYSVPYSGHYFQVQQGTMILRAPSLASEFLDTPDNVVEQKKILRLTGPQKMPLLVWFEKRTKNGQTITIMVGEDITDIEQDIAEQHRIYFFVAALTLFSLIFLQRFLIRRVIRPVDQARQQLLQIEKGERDKITEKVPAEIQPLVDELNHLLDVMNKRLERSRNATGNLAHALKTPLSVLNQLADSPEIKNNPALFEDITQISYSIQTSIDRELKRARLSGGTLPGQRFLVDEEITGLVTVMKKVYAQKNLVFDIVLPENKYYQADREDMLEMLGNILDNACKWATSRIHLKVRETSAGLHFSIEDDGVGVNENIQNQLATRGTRLDEKTPGHGLGLSIAKEIIEQYAGTIRFETSDALGGLRVEIDLPSKG